MPEFVEREPMRQRAKEARLAPILDQVMARKPASDHPPLDLEYEIPAYPRLSADQQASGKFHGWLDEYAAKLAVGESPAQRIAK